MAKFLKIKNTRHAVLIILLALLFLSSLYLIYLKYSTGSSKVCDLSASINCSTVSNSEYSIILGVPLPLLGLAYAIFNLVFFLIKHKDENKIPERIMNVLINIELMVNTLGALASLTFLFLQIFEIGAVCIFCLIFDISVLIYTALLYQEFLAKKPKS